MPESIVLLHGFGGTSRAWDGVVARLDRERYRPLAIDLPGHGAAADPSAAGPSAADPSAADGAAADAARPITFARCVERVLARAPERFALCGYSLGGRVALQVALAAPERVSRLVLVSTSPGIEDPAERAARRDADRRLADELEAAPYERFIERWRTQPLFARDPPEVDRLARADQRRNRPRALVEVLRGIGAGEMQPLWGRLGELRMPVTVVVGERDRRYLSIARRLAGEAPNARVVVLHGGHVLPLESPRALAAAIEGPRRGPVSGPDRPGELS